MASVAERRTIRADGPEKVTGSGRYAADLTLTGMLHAKLRYAGVAHGRITRLDTTRARALPGVLAVITQADVPDVRYGPYIKDRTLFASDVVRYEGEIVAAVAALTPEIAQAAVDAIELEIEPLPVVDDVEAALADDSPLVHADWESYESGDGVERSRNVAAFSSIEKGDVEAGMRRGRRDREDPLRRRRVARRADRAARDRRAVAGREAHRLVLDAGPVRHPVRAGRDARAPGEQGARDRPAPGRRLRRQVRLPPGSAHRRARAQGGPASEAALHAARGVPRPRPPARGDGDRARDGREARRHDRRPPRQAGARQRRLHGGRRVLPAARRDARRRPVPDPAPAHRLADRVHEHAALRVGARPDRAAGLLGAGAAHRRGRAPRSASTASSCAGATSSTPATWARAARRSSRSACGSASTAPPRCRATRPPSCPTTRRSASRSAGGRRSPARRART